MLDVMRAILRQSSIPIEDARPERLAANSENPRQLPVRDLPGIPVLRRQVCAQQYVISRRAVGELERSKRAGPDVHRRFHDESCTLERPAEL